MGPSSGKKDSGWILLAWGLNGLGILALSGILIFYLSQRSVTNAVEPIGNTQTPRPTRTPAPKSYYLPTVTPNPQATEIEDYSTPYWTARSTYILLGKEKANISSLQESTAVMKATQLIWQTN